MDDQQPKMTRNERQLDMWKRWQQSGDESIRTELLEDLQPLIKSHLGRYASSTLPYDNLQLRANQILRDALAKYDPSKASIGTYATHSLAPISRYVQTHQNTKYLPPYLAQEYGRFENEQRKLRNKLGREPDNEEIAEAMNLPVRHIRRIRLAKSPEVPVSTTEDIERPDVAQDTESERNRDKLYYLRTTLKGKDLKIFDLLTGMGRYNPISDRAEIARRVGVPVEEVYAKTRKWARQVK
jgi:DNA-directed RNA polymerase specialized sigma subunit